MKKKYCMFFMVCMMFLLAGCAEKINLNEYLEVEYEGINEYATATYEIDYVDLISDYDEIFGFDEDDLEDEDGEEFLEDMEDAIDGELNEDKNLKNGDELTFTWELSAKKIEDKYKVKFEYTDVTMTVEDLDELKAVDAFEGVEVTFDGPSGYATATFNARNQKYGMFLYSFSGGENLKNGDTVTVTLLDGYMEDCIEEGIMPKETVKTYKVEGLKELETFDAFYGLKVTFSGYDTLGAVTINDAAVKYDELRFSHDGDGKLSNGDTLTVTVSDSAVQKCIDRYGVIPEAMTKKYTVSGLETLVDEFSDISDEKWESIYGDWKTYILENIPKEWVTPEALTNVTYIGRTFSRPTEDSWTRDKYYITLYYELTVEQPEKEPFQYYYYLEFENWKTIADGSLTYEKCTIPSGSAGWFFVSGDIFTKDDLYYVGFETFDAIYEKMVINDRSGYNTECEFMEGYEYVIE